VHYVACSGNEIDKGTFERNSDTANGALERRFVGGVPADPPASGEPARLQGRAQRPVTRIDQSSTRAVVHTGRGAVTCKRVIVAVPPELFRAIQWGPDLPARHRALFDHMDMGDLMKCDAVYDEPFWRADGLGAVPRR
jgi:monoamine oxidase